jgi:hypothetical protein
METAARVRTYDAVAYRDGRWWTFEIGELTAPSPSGERIVARGQARSAAELTKRRVRSPRFGWTSKNLTWWSRSQ